MVVHDMRGPVTSMTIVLQEVKEMIDSIKQASLDMEQVEQSSTDFSQKLNAMEHVQKL